MKKLLSLLLLAGILNSSMAQSSYSPANTLKDKRNYTLQKNRNTSGYDDHSSNSKYTYNNQQNNSYNNTRMYDNRGYHRNMDNKGYDQRNNDRSNNRRDDMHQKKHRYPERKESHGKTAKAFGGGLILGAILGVIVGSSR